CHRKWRTVCPRHTGWPEADRMRVTGTGRRMSPPRRGAVSMSQEALVERFFETLVNGDRPAARTIIDEAWDSNASPQSVISDIMWPAHEMIERLYKADQLAVLGYHYSTRLLRVLIDQVAARLPQRARNGKTALFFCGQSQGEELG